MDVSTEVIERWAAMMGPAIAEAADPEQEAAAIDDALALDGNPSQRLGMWLALLNRPTAAEKVEALSSIHRVLADVSSIRTETAIMLFVRLADEGLWFERWAVEPCLRIVWRIGELNVETHREAVSYALRLLANDPGRREAVELVARFAALDERTLQRIASELPGVDRDSCTTLLNHIEARIRDEDSAMFVGYVESLMAWWDAFDAVTQAELIERLTPILNLEILRDFNCISALAFERTTNAIANAPQLAEDVRRTLIRELVPHSLDLAARQPIAPPLRARLHAEDPSVVEHVMETADALDPLAAAGLYLNVIEALKTSPLRFTLAERLIAAYGGWDIVRRAATIDILGREMWRFLGYTEATAIEVEGLAEASEPFIDVLEVELVEQLRSEIDALRLLSFPRI